MTTISCIYVRLPNWIGDVCMSLPSLRTLQDSGAPLVVCARPWARDLLAGVPKQDFLPMTGKVLRDRATVAAHRRALGGGAATRGLLLPDSLSSAAVFRLAGIPCAGYRDDGRSPLLRWPVDKPGASLHAVQSWHYLTRAALQRWSLPAGPVEPGALLGLPLTQAHRDAAGQLLQAQQLAGRPFVLIAPTATGLHKGKVKVWPGFDALTRALQERGQTVVMCPPPAEVAEARRNAPSATLLPPLGLGAFAALAQRAALVVCNDSGVSHVAAAVDARQLTLFGVTRPGRTGPWSPRAVCLGSETHWPGPEQVMEKSLELLSGA
ncbi:glycosyltransferase family 9 protein [Bordetella bronchiseptica]|uniref:glycosyltransferase family 9 protein n=1 Tax=Bordetella bronchiseptica TaxID=518 RepID=UPI000461B2B4|nr:glycosyltransferase family 9 protein [Bordetella bronchiseptica]AWP80828.1 heptosyltransferase [Bordetella bronchiseptica]KDC63037.1 heptosyltransferase [Bordetella bronchiseptica MBORD595]SUW07048.1 heptosyltransferase II [Bordetella bronchiseptica]VEF40634.1 ADP-heptose--LPS heptosyltransferase 2 [Bordetella bronchiseptica]VEI26803.1 heptosyltransferase II [Bordetella bronchiseptica]